MASNFLPPLLSAFYVRVGSHCFYFCWYVHFHTTKWIKHSKYNTPYNWLSIKQSKIGIRTWDTQVVRYAWWNRGNFANKTETDSTKFQTCCSHCQMICGISTDMTKARHVICFAHEVGPHKSLQEHSITFLSVWSQRNRPQSFRIMITVNMVQAFGYTLPKYISKEI